MSEKEILRTLNEYYPINFTDLELIRKGGCTSYSVSSEYEKYFLKLIPSTFIETAKQSLNILTFLNEKDFSVPKIIITKLGSHFIEIDTQEGKALWVLYEFIDGQEPEQGEDVEAIGELVGRLHRTMLDYKGNLQIQGKEYFIDRYIDILKKKNYDLDNINLFQEYGDILWSRVEHLPRGFCHGDLHRGNLLRTSSGKYYLLDFDTSCYAFPAHDIMVMCNSTNYFQFEENGYKDSRATYEEFLKGYTKYRVLSDNERKAFYDFIAIYHYQLQATIIEINGLDCVDATFLDNQLDWLMKWREQCDSMLDI